MGEVCLPALCVSHSFEWDTCSSGHLCCLKALLRGSGKCIFRALCEGKTWGAGNRLTALGSPQTPAPTEVRRPRPTEVILQRGGALQSRRGRRPRGRGPRLQPHAPLPPCPYKERPAIGLGNPVAIPAAQPQSQAPPSGMGAGQDLGGAVAGAEHIKEGPIGAEAWV